MSAINDQAAVITSMMKRITALERAAGRSDAVLQGRLDALESAPTSVSGTTTATTDLNGDLVIAYGATFVSAPIFVAINGDSATANFYVQALSRGTTSATIRTGVASTPVRVDWIAHGVLA